MAMTAAATVPGIQENVLSMEQRIVKPVNSTKTLFGLIKAWKSCHNIKKIALIDRKLSSLTPTNVLNSKKKYVT